MEVKKLIHLENVTSPLTTPISPNIIKYLESNPNPSLNPLEKQKEIVVQKIESKIIELLRSLTKIQETYLNIPKIKGGILKNVKIKLNSQKTFKKFNILLELLNLVHKLLLNEIHVTKRDLYYTYPNLFSNQKLSDSSIDEVASMLEVPRNALNIIASSKGLVTGNISFKEGKNLVNCRNGVKSISPFVEQLSDICSDALFCLIIEKETVFSRIEKEGFVKNFPSILVTGKGYPDLATRLFLKRIETELKIPLLCLIDSDPYGVEILSTYTFGSENMFYDKSIKLETTKWIGFHPSDLSKFEILSSVLLPLSQEDRKKGEELLKKKMLPESWKMELKLMMDLGVKAEIESLSCSSIFQSLHFLCNNYLPYKIKNDLYI